MDRQRFFDHHAAAWDETRPPGEEARLGRVATLAEVGPGQVVLDVGTGTGVLIPHLLRAIGPGGKVTAIDFSPGMLEVAQRKGFPANVKFQLADVHCLPFAEETFDRVICNAAFPHFDDRARSLQEMIRVLRRGGMLVISHPTGREAVNALHREAGEAVAQDRVSPAGVMAALLEDAGLTAVQVIDEPEFYLARGRKP